MNDNPSQSPLIKAFSEARLRRYMLPGEDYERAFARYQENICLSESLLPALHYLEVVLRNQLDDAIRNIYGKDWLLRVPTTLPMESYNRDRLTDAIDSFQQDKRRNPTQDDLVANMTFGFWCALFHKRYDPTLWQRKQFFASVFPNWPRDDRKRNLIQPKLYAIKDLRNRIAHHEPIWDWKPGASAGHQLCLELIGAMSQDALTRLREVDRFAGV
jgi:hypothetical protein